MADRMRRDVAEQQHIPRIPAEEARKLFDECEAFLISSGDLLHKLPSAGISTLLGALSENILLLAVQPDEHGERLRARLMSSLAPSLAGELSGDSVLSIEEIVCISNSVLPCLLLEIGRRRRHIYIEFPLNPAAPAAIFRFSPDPERKPRPLNRKQLLDLMNLFGESMVGLCYFGDKESRKHVEDFFVDGPDSANERPCRSLPSIKRLQ